MPITLNRWFQKNASRPLAVASLFVGLVWVVLFGALLSEISYQQKEGTRQLANLLSLSFSQMNRVLTESLLESSHVNLQARAAVICQGDKAIVSSNADNGDCTRGGSWLYPKITYRIPGSSDYTLVATFSKFGDRPEIWRFFLIGLIFTGGCFALLYKIKRRFLRDIFLPLQSGVFNDTPIPIEEFEQVRQKRKVIEESKEKEAALQAVLENKAKVAHNIKSPLRTLRLVQKKIEVLIPQSELKLLNGAIDSINNILGDQQKDVVKITPSVGTSPSQQASEPVLVNDFLEETIALKSAEYEQLKNIRISMNRSDDSNHVFVNVVKHEFRAILSNLINNAVDAIGIRNGFVEIESVLDQDTLKIRISDNGDGIPEDRREKIFEKGVSFNKNGTGFGLYHARQYLTLWQGKVEYSSSDNISGASFEITLPVAKAPSWCAARIEALSKKHILILDDDVLIYQVWKDRLQNLIDPSATRIHFASNEKEFEACLTDISSEISDTVILGDYDLGASSKTGLDMVKAYGVTMLTTLVTNSFQNSELIRECGKEGVRILPKPCIHLVPITT